MAKKWIHIALFSACISIIALQGCTKSSGNIGQAVFWYNLATCDSVLAYFPQETLTYRIKNGPNSHFFVDTVIGTQSNITYWPQPPTCGHPAAITFTLNMGAENNEPMLYFITRPNGNNMWSGSFNLNGGSCTSIQLTYP